MYINYPSWYFRDKTRKRLQKQIQSFSFDIANCQPGSSTEKSVTITSLFSYLFPTKKFQVFYFRWWFQNKMLITSLLLIFYFTTFQQSITIIPDRKTLQKKFLLKYVTFLNSIYLGNFWWSLSLVKKINE